MTAPAPTPPCLGEREAVARTFKRLLCKGACLTPETCAMCIPKANNVADVFVAEHIEPLRAENETLRAERDAAIARAEDLERRADWLTDRRDLWLNEAQRLALLVRELGGTPEPSATERVDLKTKMEALRNAGQ